MTSTCGRLLVLGGHPLHGSDALDSRMVSCLWDLSLGKRTGDGRFDEETFLGGLLIFFLGGRGRGRGTAGHDYMFLGVGMSTLGAQTAVLRGSGAPSTDDPGV
jgi:hypothetical protein